ncbi:MAG TPA: MFS transporter [Solirubrobacterales bacterium]|nr:MFS transporter [Solirubrobacterales bacterium]
MISLLRSRALAIYLIAGTTFAGGLARNFLVPLRAHELGANRITIGLLATVGLLVAAALSLPSGYLTDRIGRRGMILVSIVFGLVAQLISAATPAIWPLFAGSVIGGIGLGATQTALFAALVDNVERYHVGRAMGWLTFSMQAGFLVGPAGAGVLLAFVSTQTDLAISSLFWIGAIPLAMPLAGGSRQATWRFNIARELLGRPGFRAALLGTFAIAMIWGTIQGFLPIFGKEGLALPGSLIGYLLAVQAAANGISRLFVGRLTDRFEHQWPLVLIGCLGTGAAVIVLPHLSGFGAPAALLALSVPFTALSFVALSVSFANLSTNANRGLVMGFYSAALFVGLGLGPAVYGPAMQVSYVEGFTLTGIVGIAMSLLVPLVRSAPRRSPSVVMPPAA